MDSGYGCNCCQCCPDSTSSPHEIAWEEPRSRRPTRERLITEFQDLESRKAQMPVIPFSQLVRRPVRQIGFRFRGGIR